MKKSLILFLLIFLGIKFYSQNTINFSYDAGGNMVQRQITILLQARLGAPENLKDSSATSSINFKIYPNPTNQFVNIEGELPPDITEAIITLSSINGQILKTDKYNGQAKSIDVANLKSGMYLLEIIYSKNKINTYKIVITN